IIFTLNQDLFIERRLEVSGGRPELPFMELPSFWGSANKGREPLTQGDYRPLPNEEELSSSRIGRSNNVLYYVKLHGSLNWIDSEGHRRLVIGRNKEDAITAEPLLNHYFKLFNETLYSDPKKLLCIGYSFRDQHINQVIVNAIKNYSLELYVLNPQSPGDFFDSFDDSSTGEAIKTGLKAYYPYTLIDIFSGNQRTTFEWCDILESYFGEKPYECN
ncbi:MAG: SIR2 family protein, partial [Thermodesulfobacteriota bacterium]